MIAQARQTLGITADLAVIAFMAWLVWTQVSRDRHDTPECYPQEQSR